MLIPRKKARTWNKDYLDCELVKFRRHHFTRRYRWDDQREKKLIEKRWQIRSRVTLPCKYACITGVIDRQKQRIEIQCEVSTDIYSLGCSKLENYSVTDAGMKIFSNFSNTQRFRGILCSNLPHEKKVLSRTLYKTENIVWPKFKCSRYLNMEKISRKTFQ